MIEKMYYDSFANEYVLTKDPIAPPERYITTLRGEEGIYIEKFRVYLKGQESDTEYFLDVAYTEEEYKTQPNRIRFGMAEKNNCSLGAIVRWSIPPSRFDRYVEMFDLKEPTEQKIKGSD